MRELATALYDQATDMDYMDYEDAREEAIDDLENALHWLKSKADEDVMYTALFRVLELIAD